MDKMTSNTGRDFLMGLVSRSVTRDPQIALFADPVDCLSRGRFSFPDGPGLSPRRPAPVIRPELLEQDAERWDGMA